MYDKNRNKKSACRSGLPVEIIRATEVKQKSFTQDWSVS